MKNTSPESKYDLEIWTEGKTDWQILKRAFESLEVGLKIKFHEYNGDMGDSQLLKRCETFAEKEQPTPMVFLFDHDKKETLERVMSPGKKYKSWGNNVYSFAIPIPKHRAGYQNISIEFYFSDEELRTYNSNRRLYLTSEFVENSGKLRVDPRVSLGNKNVLKGCTENLFAKVIDTEVFNENNSNIALSKSDFAKALAEKEGEFADFRFDAFMEIADILKLIAIISKPTISIYTPEIGVFTQELLSLSYEERLEKISRLIFDITLTALSIFSAITIRSYEDEISKRHVKRNKKAEAIEKILKGQFTSPGLKDFVDLARSCYHIIDNNAPDELRTMKSRFEKNETLGAIGLFLDDLENLFPPKAFTPTLADKHKLQRGFLVYTASEFAKYNDNQIHNLKNALQEKKPDYAKLEKKWLETLERLIEFFQPMFNNPLELRSLEYIDTSNEKCMVHIRRYETNKLVTFEQSVPLEEADQYESNITDLLLSNNKRIHLYPFLLIKDDELFTYRRGRAQGFEYKTLTGGVYTKITQKKISKYIIRGGSKQERFWIDIIPAKNTLGVKANIPDDDLSNFVGRQEQMKTIIEEIIEIPNQNGIVYGPGGIGKTALMIQLSRLLYNEIDPDNVLYDNIIWVSAKSDLFDYDFGTVEQQNPQFKRLSQILSAILEFFGNEDANEYKLDDKKSIVIDLLKENRILLVLDNVETISSAQMDKIVRFFGVEVKRELRKKPGNFKVIITSRKQIACDFHQIQIKGLDETEAIELMDKLAENYKYKEPLSNAQKRLLHQATKGIPIVIKHCFVKIFVNNETFDSVVESLEHYSSEIVQFSFKELLRQIETLDKEKIQLSILILLELTNIPLMVRQIAEILETEEVEVTNRVPALVDFQCISRLPFEKNDKYFINPEIRLLTRALSSRS